MEKIEAYRTFDGKLFDDKQQAIEHAGRLRKTLVTRAENAIAALKRKGMDPSEMSDAEILRNVRNVGKLTLPILRELTGVCAACCPHCGGPLGSSSD